MKANAEVFRHEASVSIGNAPTSYALAGRASLLARDIEGAAADLAAFIAAGMHGPYVEARERELRAGVAALDGRSADALALYADTFRRFRDLGVEFDAAFTTIEIATLPDPALPAVVAAGEVARETLTRLRARPFLARLDATLSRSVAAGAENGSVAPARKGSRSSSVKAG